MTPLGQPLAQAQLFILLFSLDMYIIHAQYATKASAATI